jgi:signal transduction histidine kinase
MKSSKLIKQLIFAAAVLQLVYFAYIIFSGHAYNNVKDNIYLFAASFYLLIIVIMLAVFATRLETFTNMLKKLSEMVHGGKRDLSELSFPTNKFGQIVKELADKFTELKKAEKYKQELTHNIAHELKTPVSSIRGYLETLLQQTEIDNETRVFFIERAYNQCLRLSSIIADISVLNNIEEAGERIEAEPVDIKKCLSEIRNDLSMKLSDKNINLIEEIEENLTIEGNPFLFYALFKNLIDNSIEHGGENITIYVGGKDSGNGNALFRFYDTGVGVSEKHLSRIFERFYRIDEGRNRKRGGSGLGLAIVKHTILMHNGTISAVNRDGGGLQFDFSIAIKRKLSEDSPRSGA